MVAEAVSSTHQPVTITRHVRPAATLIATEDLEILTETLAWLADPEHAAELAEAGTRSKAAAPSAWTRCAPNLPRGDDCAM